MTEPLAILVHGRNQGPETMHEIARRLSPSLVGRRLVVPEAPEKTWYPKGFMAPFEENEPWLDHALSLVDAAVREHGPRRDIALIGFSQGACLLCEYVFRNPARWGALIAFTGGLLGPAGTTWARTASLEGTPVYLGTSVQDTWVPIARVRETADVFRAMGAEVELDEHDDAEHHVNDREIERARRVLVPED